LNKNVKFNKKNHYNFYIKIKFDINLERDKIVQLKKIETKLNKITNIRNKLNI